MRITNNMMISNMMINLQNNMNVISKSEQMLSTGKKFIVPSDDPIAMAKSLRLHTDLNSSEQYKKNCDDAISWMNITEDAINNVQQVLNRIRDLSVQAANGTNTDSDTQKISSEVEQLKGELVNQANATYAGRYIFSGYKTDSKLMNDDGTYNVTVGKACSQTFKTSDAAIAGPGAAGSITIKVKDTTDQSTTSNITKSTNTVRTVTLKYPAGATWQDIKKVINGDPATGTWDPAALGFSIDDTTTTTVNDLTTKPAPAAVVTPTTTNITVPSSVLKDMNMTADIVQTDANNSKLVINVNSSLVSTTSSDPAKLISIAAQPEDINYQVSVSDNITVNTVGTDIFGLGVNGGEPKMLQDIDKFISALKMDTENPPIGQKSTDVIKDKQDALQDALKNIDDNLNQAGKVRAQLGAKANRAQLTSNRLDDENTNFTQLLSDNEDIDYEKVIMDLTNQENVYRASLQIGAKVIEPTLSDFIK